MRRIALVCLFALLLTVSVPAVMADNIDITGSNVVYMVNIGNIYVSSSPLNLTNGQTKQTASSTFSNNAFQFKVGKSTSGTYAGILIGFDGSLTLGELQSLSIASTDNTLSISLWLDTDNNGKFLNFSNGVCEANYAGDTMLGSASHSGNKLDLGTSLDLYMIDGGNPSTSSSYTLADLQSGNSGLGGVDANTRVAIWIGISNASGANSANVSGITLDPICVPEPNVLLLLAIGIGAVGLLSGRIKR